MRTDDVLYVWKMENINTMHVTLVPALYKSPYLKMRQNLMEVFNEIRLNEVVTWVPKSH